MRTFETALIVINLLTLLLSLKRQPRTVWFAAAGLNLLLLVLHGLLEGVRYQMAFSYLLVIGVTLYAFARAIDLFDNPHGRRRLSALGVLLTTGALLLLSLTAYLAYALPVFDLPAPTGGYAVGVEYFQFMDKSRRDPFLDHTDQPREVLVKIYYPAVPDQSKPYLPYFGGSRDLVRLFAAGYGMPEPLFYQLNLVKTHAQTGLALPYQEDSFPVILFSHGAGTSAEVQTAQSEDLASHGYIVAAIDHPYVSSATVFPDRIISHKDATTDFNTADPAEVITQIMAEDVRFVISQLDAMNAGEIASIFHSRMNLEQIGVVGHSVGGAVAYNLALNDSRVKAAVNLDGVVYVTPRGEGAAPFLMLASDGAHARAMRSGESLMKPLADLSAEEQEMQMMMYGSAENYQEVYFKAQQNLTGLLGVLGESGNLFTIAGSDHMKFTDIGLFIGDPRLRALINIRGETDPAQVLAITRDLTRAFFDQHLKGEGQEIENLLQAYEQLIRLETASLHSQ